MLETERHADIVSMTANARGKEIITLCGGCTEALNDHGQKNSNMVEFLYNNID